MEKPFVHRSHTAVLQPTSYWPLAALGGWGALITLFGALQESFKSSFAGGAMLTVMFLGPLFFYAGIKSANASVRSNPQLEFSPEGVRSDGKLLVSRKEVNNGYLRYGADERWWVSLGRKDALIETHNIQVKDQAEGQAVLRALRLDVAHNTFVHREAGWFLYSAAVTKVLVSLLALGLVSFIPLLIALKGSVLGALPAMLGGLSFFGPMWGTRSQLVIGADGVLVQWLGYERYCSFADVARIVRTEHGVRLEKRDGSSFDVPINRAITAPSGAEERNAVIARLEEAFALHSQRGQNDLGFDPNTLTRNDRTVDAWVTALRGLTQTASQRTAALVPEQLWKLLTDPEAPSEVRAAAAVVLSPELDASGKERLRAASENTASTQLRAVFENAASDDDQALHQALDELVSRRKD